MKQTFLGWLSSLFLAAMVFVGTVHAQAPPATGESERNPPAAQYAFASLTAMVLLIILCMPSRKRSA